MFFMGGISICSILPLLPSTPKSALDFFSIRNHGVWYTQLQQGNGQFSLMPHRLLPSHQQGRAVQHQPFGFLGGHKFARGRIDQFHALIAHLPELLDKRLHIPVSTG